MNIPLSPCILPCAHMKASRTYALHPAHPWVSTVTSLWAAPIPHPHPLGNTRGQACPWPPKHSPPPLTLECGVYCHVSVHLSHRWVQPQRLPEASLNVHLGEGGGKVGRGDKMGQGGGGDNRGQATNCKPKGEGGKMENEV